MKKETFFIVSSALLILLSFFLLLSMDEIVAQQMKAFEEIAASDPDGEKVLTLLQNGSFSQVLKILCAIQMGLSIYLFYCAQKGFILIKKGKLIGASIFCLLTSVHSFVFILSLINIIALISCKRKNIDDYPEKTKLELPENTPTILKQEEKILLGILVAIYGSQLFLDDIIPSSIAYSTARIIAISYYGILFVLSTICLATIFKNDIKLFFLHPKNYLHHVLPLVGFMYIAYFSLSYIAINITGASTSINQSAIEELPLWISAPLGIIWAPIVEEIIFRGFLKKVIKNNTAFVIISGIVFGLLHTMTEKTLVNILGLAVPYATLGMFLAYIYQKTDNLSNSILVHAFHNTIGTIVMALLKA